MKPDRTLDLSFVVKVATAGVLCFGLVRAATAVPATQTLAGPEEAARANWRVFMSHNPASEEGCFQALYSSFFWEKMECKVASPKAHPVRRVPKAGAPEVTGNGNDYVAQAA